MSCSDADERARVRELVQKKLGLSGDAELDAAILSVCETMKADRTKSRVTFYYLVADKLGKLGSL